MFEKTCNPEIGSDLNQTLIEQLNLSYFDFRYCSSNFYSPLLLSDFVAAAAAVVPHLSRKPGPSAFCSNDIYPWDQDSSLP